MGHPPWTYRLLDCSSQCRGWSPGVWARLPAEGNGLCVERQCPLAEAAPMVQGRREKSDPLPRVLSSFSSPVFSERGNSIHHFEIKLRPFETEFLLSRKPHDS